jgi:hypothetical protein
MKFISPIHSLCGAAREILDEVHQSNPLQRDKEALEECNNYNQIPTYQLAIPVLVLWVGASTDSRQTKKKTLVTKNLDVRNIFAGFPYARWWT